MRKPIGPVWVIAEQVNGQVLPTSLQLVGHGRKLADELGVYLEVLLLGSHLDQQSSQLIAAGADIVFQGDDPLFEYYQSEIYPEVITRIVADRRPDILMIGSTSMGRELAPLLAAHFRTGLTVHSTDMILNGELILEQKVPAYGVILSITCAIRRPQMVIVARGVFPNPQIDNKRVGEIIKLEVPQNLSPRIELLEVIPIETTDVTLEDATIVVAGGAGLVDLSGWRLINELAEMLDAAVGSTRPAVDEGWTNLDTMIGQSGKITTPDLYIGAGISGELQHMVGIMGAKTMVAINNDRKAPIFQQVDYGIVDDCREFLPILIKELEKYKKTKIEVY